MIWTSIFLLCFIVLAYQRAALSIWTVSTIILLVFFSRWSQATVSTIGLLWLIFFFVFLPLYVFPLRRYLFTGPVFNFYRKMMPNMSSTEREALAAGTVSWEGELFRGNPDWHKLLAMPVPSLSLEEKAFLDGPVHALCDMINDWDITHNRADLPPELWQFIKEQGFFGLIIPKEYGGKAFSAYAHSQILTKIYSCSVTVATTVGVPNSLGPAELLLHYGTAEQKQYYLPRLARGEEIPCFALTSAEAGSDAGAMVDQGVVMWGEYEGQRVLGIRLNWNKRYITLAPIATVIGLAFKLYDPDHLLGDKKEIGITCALIPRYVSGITAGRRHFPLGAPFQHGPIRGENVFIPIEWIIGGPAMAGKGWRMLMECLAAGRAISLPASAMGGCKLLTYTAGAYARIRKQFGVPIGYFEGIQDVLARIAGHTYIMDAARSFAVCAIDQGEKPAVASAIVKYHVTELGRKVANDAMDLHGGKTICLGPKNYLGQGYTSIPIAITVEGANILTRNLIIFGQGVMRCHPYVLSELEAACHPDVQQGLRVFDKVLLAHIGFSLGNVVRSVVLGLTGGHLVYAPSGKMRRYFQQATRFSSAFALLADVSLLVLGSNLKRKESISARLGDILSYLYLLSSVLKQFHDQGNSDEDIAIVRWACETCLYEIQNRFNEILKNFPYRWMGRLLRVWVFPLGQHFSKPSDKLTQRVAQLLLAPTSSRLRLATGAYLPSASEKIIAQVDDALLKVVVAEPIEKIIKAAAQKDIIRGFTMLELASAALSEGVISQSQYTAVLSAEEARKKVIAVDDFTSEELAHHAAN